MYQYEIAYESDTDCSNNALSQTPDGYINATSNGSIEVFGLMSGTCYVFGVRVYVQCLSLLESLVLLLELLYQMV